MHIYIYTYNMYAYIYIYMCIYIYINIYKHPDKDPDPAVYLLSRGGPPRRRGNPIPLTMSKIILYIYIKREEIVHIGLTLSLPLCFTGLSLTISTIIRFIYIYRENIVHICTELAPLPSQDARLSLLQLYLTLYLERDDRSYRY